VSPDIGKDESSGVSYIPRVSYLGEVGQGGVGWGYVAVVWALQGGESKKTSVATAISRNASSAASGVKTTLCSSIPERTASRKKRGTDAGGNLTIQRTLLGTLRMDCAQSNCLSFQASGSLCGDPDSANANPTPTLQEP